MKNASVNQRIPHLLKAKPGEVFFIGGGEAGDAVVAEGEGERSNFECLLDALNFS